MPPDAAYDFLVLAEDRAAAENARILADRVAIELSRTDVAFDWFDSDSIDTFRAWRSDRHGAAWWPLHGFAAQARIAADGERPGFRARIHGTYSEKDNDERVFRRALVGLNTLDEDPDLVVLAKDSDAKALRGAFEAALARFDGTLVARVVLAEMRPEAQAWRIVAFEPASDAEHEALAALRADLGHDARDAERLTSKKAGKRDAKTVLIALTGDDEARGLAALNAPLSTLRDVPASCGLPAYLADVEGALKSLVSEPE